MNAQQLAYLKTLAETDFDGAIVWAENNVNSLKDFFDTWASHCGASKETFKGHVIATLVRLD